jgi:hypothetical protein
MEVLRDVFIQIKLQILLQIISTDRKEISISFFYIKSIFIFIFFLYIYFFFIQSPGSQYNCKALQQSPEGRGEYRRGGGHADP